MALSAVIANKEGETSLFKKKNCIALSVVIYVVHPLSAVIDIVWHLSAVIDIVWPLSAVINIV